MTQIIVKDSAIHGRGVFAARDIRPGEVIIDWDELKENLTEHEVKRLSPEERKRVSFIDGQYILFKPPACWVNHSCNANARGTNGRDLAIRAIKGGEEITVDYIVENVPDLNFRCNCGSQICRGFLRPESPIPVTIRPARPDDIETISATLQEAARWLEDTGKPMWRDSELLPSRVADDVNAGLFVIAVLNTEPAGVIKFQLADPLFWPDAPHTDSAFVHRLAVRRRFAGQGISTALLNWAAENARSLGKRYLRLDCEASRQKLRAIYERFGFQHHSDRQVGPYFVSRYEYSLA